MNINEVKDAILYVLKANPHQPIMIWGPPGVGKSDMVAQIYSDLGLAMFDVRLSQMDSTDLRGIPSVEGGVTRFNPPGDFPSKPGCGIFLDEINSAARSVSAAAMQLIRDRALGQYQVPEGTPVLAAGNRVKDQAVANRMPSALNNRFLHFEAEAELNTLVQYALANGWPIHLIQFLRFRPNLLLDVPKPVVDGEAFPSPRSWEAVVDSKALEANTVVRRSIVKAAVGTGAMSELESFLSVFPKLPNLDLIMASPSAAQLPTEPSVKYAVVAALVHKAAPQNVSSILQYLGRFREKEWVSMAVNDMIRSKESLRNSSQVVGWLAQNRAA